MSLARDLRFLSQISIGLWHGLRFRRKHGKTVTIFGSARLAPDHRYYVEARNLAQALAERGLSIMTGGGRSIMQAANEGAHRVGGESIGINIEISREHQLNPYVSHGMKSRYFFVRKVLLFRNSTAFIAFPGGFGTLDELFEIVTLVQTQKTAEHPIILMHSEFWSGLLQWCRNVLIPAGMISEKELSRLKLADSVEQAVEILAQWGIMPSDQRSKK